MTGASGDGSHWGTERISSGVSFKWSGNGGIWGGVWDMFSYLIVLLPDNTTTSDVFLVTTLASLPMSPRRSPGVITGYPRARDAGAVGSNLSPVLCHGERVPEILQNPSGICDQSNVAP
jgi:hypothetical protein